MRHSTLVSGALGVNARPLFKYHAPISTVLGSSPSRRLPSTATRRSYSAATPEPRQAQQQPAPTPTDSSTTTEPRTFTPAEQDVFPAAANPPSTTRPPPLTLPARQPDTTTFNHLFATGKAYLTFYKTGLKHIYTNTRLLYPSRSTSSTTQSDTPARRPDPSTRSDLHLRLRWRHDIRRLPLFALMLLICGEFTPFVVLVVPRVVPLTCRIPQQVDKLLRGEEARRRRGREEARSRAVVGKAGDLEEGTEVKLLAEVLGLSSFSWTPGFVLAPKVQARLKFLAVDDALLVQAGGEPALVADEVRLACADRGIAVLGRSVEEMREALGKWLRLTDARKLGEEGSERARVRLLLADEGEWGA
ncbi:Letm1 RBD domain-containing protein [Madurella fahalii]|uniref:Letm1 RBD domain-containing protein n=1 Tax=Madurella fahalii TaxID=1157608 RepID=A0ABQ0GIG3_9PEZI